ncbi:hypothetical protein LPB67_07830 [Undibacterium sp. Jales W-56]|uniref:contact-dependent growth inhibition system immunity protein n=1 Tax=Undibacterium sp. Jales W-56 TaxID=2897325 RepID=UPI0021CE7596|nr:contact-dependent growth inhibition system immunity protein [Undibacterium sp. Jales W-56]MCU6433687.1 hypothetical protein [Undibacterium sp. Jales W-56]
MKFADLETTLDAELIDKQQSSFMSWYMSIREIPIEKMELDDICKALRQRLFVTHVLPVGIMYLKADVLAGDDYEGQLISALKILTHEDWSNCPIEAQRAIHIIQNALDNKSIPATIEHDARQILDAVVR